MIALLAQGYMQAELVAWAQEVKLVRRVAYMLLMAAEVP
jgi:hypothetical protein